MKYSPGSIFITFLKLGAVSFGGYMSLIAVVHTKFVEEDKSLENDLFTDMVSISSFLPGPVAVNVVSAVGYQLLGVTGALLAFFGVLLPAFTFMGILYYFYDTFSDFGAIRSFFNGATFVIIAIIFSVAYNMLKKQWSARKVLFIVPVSFVLLFFFHAFWQLLIVLFFSGVIGWMLYRNSSPSTGSQKISWWTFVLPVAFFGMIYLIPTTNIHLDLLTTFSTVSVTLFGGGYVMIPILQDIVVANKQWLTQKEFMDSIALGQVTPGPILISAAFVGFKQAGFWGGIVATLAIFMPSAMIMVVVFNNLRQWLGNRHVKAFFTGLRMAVIGMIFYAGVKFFSGQEITWVSVFIVFLSFLLLVFYKLNPVYLIVFGGLTGLCLHYLHL